MATYTVDFRRVQQVLADMEAVDKQIRALLDGLERDSESSLREWQSDARQAYTGCKRRWDASAQQMTAQLQQARGALAEIMANYQGAERAGSGMWGG